MRNLIKTFASQNKMCNQIGLMELLAQIFTLCPHFAVSIVVHTQLKFTFTSRQMSEVRTVSSSLIKWLMFAIIFHYKFLLLSNRYAQRKYPRAFYVKLINPSPFILSLCIAYFIILIYIVSIFY